MMPGPLAKTQVLMFGTDDALLRIRAKVLATIGCETQVVCSEEQTREALRAMAPKPQLVILCHTAEEEDTERIRRISLQANIPTYSVERMIPPQHLIDDVKRVLSGKPAVKEAKARP
jgi:hypothetical protein